MRYIRYILALHSLQGVTLRYIDQKIEFLNSFVSLTEKSNKSNIFTCVRPPYYTALFKDKNIIVRATKRLLGHKMMNPLEQAKRELWG